MVKVEKIPGSKLKKVTFLLHGEPGHHVALAGSFGDWDPNAFEMNYSETECGYICSMELPAGVYEYKMVVDGKWVLDEDNQNFSANDFGTLNSVVNVG